MNFTARAEKLDGLRGQVMLMLFNYLYKYLNYLIIYSTDLIPQSTDKPLLLDYLS